MTKDDVSKRVIVLLHQNQKALHDLSREISSDLGWDLPRIEAEAKSLKSSAIEISYTGATEEDIFLRKSILSLVRNLQSLAKSRKPGKLGKFSKGQSWKPDTAAQSDQPNSSGGTATFNPSTLD